MKLQIELCIMLKVRKFLFETPDLDPSGPHMYNFFLMRKWDKALMFFHFRPSDFQLFYKQM